MPGEEKLRRKVLKSIGGATAFSGVVSVGSAKSDNTPSTQVEPPYDFEYKTVGDDVRDVMGPMWWLLTIDRGRLDELLSKSPTPRSKTQQKQDTLTELRSEYQVELTRNEQNERELSYHLSSRSYRPLDETDIGAQSLEEEESGKKPVKSIADDISLGLEQENSRHAEPHHDATVHDNMGEVAIEGTEYEEYITGQFGGDCKEPDSFDNKCDVCHSDWFSAGDSLDLIDVPSYRIGNKIAEKIQDIDDSASPHHMYIPGGESLTLSDFVPGSWLPSWAGSLEIELEGVAHKEGQSHWDVHTNGWFSNWVEAGYAFHFLQDVSHPLHTGAIAEQALYGQGTAHNGYRRFIEYNWERAGHTDKKFKDEFERGKQSPQWEGSFSKSCEQIAIESTKYSDQIYETIIDNGKYFPNQWDDMVEPASYACVWMAGAYSMGAIQSI